MRNFGVGSLAAMSLAYGCGGAPAALPPAQTPDAFALQFVGTYSSMSNVVSMVSLHRDGTYIATVRGRSETGVYVADLSGAHSFPLQITYQSETDSWTGTIDDNDGDQTVQLDGVTVSLATGDVVGPHEDLCTDSGGSWTDDDADRDTGLYCRCPAGDDYIPSTGGCSR